MELADQSPKRLFVRPRVKYFCSMLALTKYLTPKGYCQTNWVVKLLSYLRSCSKW